MQWTDLESLGWRVHRYDEKTQRYIYQTPIRKGMRKKIASKRDLDPSDRKYAEILFPKNFGKAAGALCNHGENTIVEGGGSSGVIFHFC